MSYVAMSGTFRTRMSLAVVAGLVVSGLTVVGQASAGVDVLVNDPTTDSGESTTQSETSLAYGNGVLCAGFNDFGPPAGLSGLANSTDLGANWTDQGGMNERGDPVIVHHTASDTFYYASLGNQSIRVAASTDGCATFAGAASASTIFNAPNNTTTLADKPWIAVDNTGGASDGNLYICWTRFIDTNNDGNADTSELRSARSTDGGTTWTNEQVIAAQGTAPFGCSIGVSSDASVAVVWADRSDNNIYFRRSTDAAQNWGGAQQVNSAALQPPGSDNVVMCDLNRPTLNGNIRQLHQAWLAVDTTGGANDGNLYVVFASDPAGATDQSDVFFSVSTNNGANWSAQLQLGAGGGATDQWEPHVAVADNGDVGVAWYDRRNDTTNNMNIDVYADFSSDGGQTFGNLTRVTDQSFAVPQLNPPYDNGMAICYMGEYLAVAGQGGGFYFLWGDNRNTVTTTAFPAGRPDPDVFFDAFPGPSNVAPDVSVDPASGDEGSAIGLTGTATDADGDFLLFSWTVTPQAGVDAGAVCNITDGDTLAPTVTCSDDGTYTAELTVTGDLDGVVTASNTLTVSNVAPTVSETSGDATIDEGDSYTMTADFADPGWNDTYTGSIDWDFPGEGPEGFVPSVTTQGPPADLGTITGTRQYGDNGSFTVTAEVVDDDGGADSDAVTVTVNNVAPTAEIDESGAVVINGVPTFLTNAGDPIDFSARSTDPGSDDLTMTWDWDDGPPAPDVTEVSLVNPPGTDPLPSPSVQPRDVTSDQTHSFDLACRYDIVFDSTDDDGGHASDTAVVIIVGNDDQLRSAGFWAHQYRGKGNVHFTDQELQCFLEIVDFVSLVFNETRAASTFAEAFDVLTVNGTADMAELLDRQLLAALLNFANGSVAWDELIDTDGDSVGDTEFSAVIAGAETARNNPASTRAELEVWKNLLEAINLAMA